MSHPQDYTQEIERKAKPFDEVGAIMAYEQGDLDGAGTLELFSHLIKTGLAWQLQGCYGRAAARLIEAGYIEQGTGKVLRDLDE